MIDSILTKFDASFQHVYSTSKFINALEEEKLTLPDYHNYLRGVHYIVSRTPLHLAMAFKQAKEQNLNNWCNYFEDKITEEKDHDLWAKADAKKTKTDLNVAPTQCAFDLMKYVESLIAKDCRLYLAYIMYTEAFTVKYGPRFLAKVEKTLNIPSSSISVIKNHEEADRHHCQENITLFESLLPLPSEAQFLQTINEIEQQTINFYDSFLNFNLERSSHARV